MFCTITVYCALRWDLGSGIWDLGSGIWDLGSGSGLDAHTKVKTTDKN